MGETIDVDPMQWPNTLCAVESAHNRATYLSTHIASIQTPTVKAISSRSFQVQMVVPSLAPVLCKRERAFAYRSIEGELTYWPTLISESSASTFDGGPRGVWQAYSCALINFILFVYKPSVATLSQYPLFLDPFRGLHPSIFYLYTYIQRCIFENSAKQQRPASNGLRFKATVKKCTVRSRISTPRPGYLRQWSVQTTRWGKRTNDQSINKMNGIE